MSSLDDSIVVLGAGAAGIWAAATLVNRGVPVTLVDAGPLQAIDNRVDRAASLGSQEQYIQRLCSAYTQSNSHLFVSDSFDPYEFRKEEPFHWFRGRHVGGRMNLWAGVCLRLSERELDQNEFDWCRWPLTYNQLAPHYAMVERVMRVTGGAEECAAVPAPRSTHSVQMSEGETLLREGIRHWPSRFVLSARVAQTNIYDVLSFALSTGRLRLLTDHAAVELLLDFTGTRVAATLLKCRRTGRSRTLSGRSFLLACSTIETLRLLLASQSPSHPGGIGNENGLLGRRLMDHTAGVAISGTAPVPFHGHSSGENSFIPVVHIPDFSYDEGRDGFQGGFGITAFSPQALPVNEKGKNLIMPNGEAPEVSTFRMWASGESLPKDDRRVTLSEQCDADDVRVAKISYPLYEEDYQQASAQLSACREIAEAAGYSISQVHRELAVPGTSNHEVGGAPMGSSPASSVLDPYNRVWGVLNLQVIDGACFPRAGWQNPTLTIMALARRAALQLEAQLRSGSV